MDVGTEGDVIGYLNRAMSFRSSIDCFICSHRDADHMRGIKRVHQEFPIQQIIDANVPGTSPNTAEYRDYMDLRRLLHRGVVGARTFSNLGHTTVRWMNSEDRRLSDANDQSIVLKLEHGGCGVLLTADTSFRPWKDIIVPFYDAKTLRANILLASHHGSISFFDDPSNNQYYYTKHIQQIQPEMTVVSVGPNTHGLPDKEALKLYEKYSTGSNSGIKLWSTESEGSMKLSLKGGGAWNMKAHQ